MIGAGAGACEGPWGAPEDASAEPRGSFAASRERALVSAKSSKSSPADEAGAMGVSAGAGACNGPLAAAGAKSGWSDVDEPGGIPGAEGGCEARRACPGTGGGADGCTGATLPGVGGATGVGARIVSARARSSAVSCSVPSARAGRAEGGGGGAAGARSSAVNCSVLSALGVCGAGMPRSVDLGGADEEEDTDEEEGGAGMPRSVALGALDEGRDEPRADSAAAPASGSRVRRTCCAENGRSRGSFWRSCANKAATGVGIAGESVTGVLRCASRTRSSGPSKGGLPVSISWRRQPSA